MKKVLVSLLFCIFILAFVYAMAENSEHSIYANGTFIYIFLDDGTVEITEYRGIAEKLEIPDKIEDHIVTSIGKEAFRYTTTLSSITIPDSVVNIGDLAFCYCKSLRNVTIPDSVHTIGMNPFLGCEELSFISVSPDNTCLATIDGVLFSKEDKRLISFPCSSSICNYVIPNGIQIIGAWSFANCENLTNVIIPDSVTSIGDYSFGCCINLNTITIPVSVTRIGYMSFFYCAHMTSITIPDSVISIGNMAFDSCNQLSAITVGRDSYARQYCIDHNLPYTYADANDWLMND